MVRSSRSHPIEDLLELPEDDLKSEEDADYSGDELSEANSSFGDNIADPMSAEDDNGHQKEEAEEARSVDLATNINPYEVLGLAKEATPADIRKMYHKAALKHHPDKVSAERREQANVKFKEIAFAYSILSDSTKRKLYDTTGRLDDEGGHIDWTEFMNKQYKIVINEDIIEGVRKEYVGSQEERDDVLAAYRTAKGDWTKIFEQVMLSVMLDSEDEERFRGYIGTAIAEGEIKLFKAYQETEAQRSKRLRKAQREAKEAEKILKKMGIKQDPAKMTEDELAILIRARRPDSFAKLDDDATEALARHYEDKYGTPKKKKKRKSSTHVEPPSEEEFQAAQARIKQRRVDHNK